LAAPGGALPPGSFLLTLELPVAVTIISQVREADMAHWRKRNPTASRFNAQLTGWAIALSALAVVLLVLSIHGHA